MNLLRRILSEQRKPLAAILAERVEKDGIARFLELPHAKCDVLLDTFASVGEGDGLATARAWAVALAAESAAQGVPVNEIFAGLYCLQRSLRLFIVRNASTKGHLTAGLSEMGRRIERMRQAYLSQSAGDVAPRASASDLTHFVDQAPHAICLANLHGKPIYLNRAARRLFQLADDANLADLAMHRFYTHESWTELRDVAVPAVNAQGSWEGRSELRRAGEESAPVHTSLFLLRGESDRPTAVAWVHHDARPLLALESALAEAEGRKRAVLETALDPIITIDADGRISEFNRAAEQVFGHRRGAVIGTRPADLLFPKDKIPGQQDRIDRYLEAGEGSMLGRRAEMTAVRANGDFFPVELAMTIGYKQGQPVLTLFVRDISLRKQAEEAQQRYAAELERSNRELEQFAYVASHDLQEPLRKIRVFGERLETACQDRLDETGRECIDRMQNAAARMQTLIEGLLLLSRVTTREQKFAPVDLSQVVREVISDLESQIERNGGRVEVCNLPTIEADALQVRQLFQNLIGNALKFHRKDEPPVVKVHGRYVHGRNQRAPSDQEQCRIVIEDNGIGFEAKYEERIFGVFQRLHPRDVFEGTGIGLAICRRIVERHNGTITAHSVPGSGSTFEVLLPVRQTRRPAANSRAADD